MEGAPGPWRRDARMVALCTLTLVLSLWLACRRERSGLRLSEATLLAERALLSIGTCGSRAEHKQMVGRAVEECERYIRAHPRDPGLCRLHVLRARLLQGQLTRWAMLDEIERIPAKCKRCSSSEEVVLLRSQALRAVGACALALDEMNDIRTASIAAQREIAMVCATAEDVVGRLRSEIAAESVIIGEQAPHHKYKTLDGQSLSIAETQKRVVLLSFWRPGGPALNQHLRLVKYLYRMHGTNPSFLLVNVCIGDDTAATRDEILRTSAPGVHVVAGVREAADFGVFSLPGFAIIDRDGVVRDKTPLTPSPPDPIETEAVVRRLLSMSEEETMGDEGGPRLAELRGDLRRACGDSRGAVSEYREALALLPGNARLLVKLAKECSEMGDSSEEARAYIEACSSLCADAEAIEAVGAFGLARTVGAVKSHLEAVGVKLQSEYLCLGELLAFGDTKPGERSSRGQGRVTAARGRRRGPDPRQSVLVVRDASGRPYTGVVVGQGRSVLVAARFSAGDTARVESRHLGRTTKVRATKAVCSYVDPDLMVARLEVLGPGLPASALPFADAIDDNEVLHAVTVNCLGGMAVVEARVEERMGTPRATRRDLRVQKPRRGVAAAGAVYLDRSGRLVGLCSFEAGVGRGARDRWFSIVPVWALRMGMD